MKKLIIIILLGAIAPSNTLFAQFNRLNIHSGLFHLYFDGTPIVNTERMITNPSLKSPLNILGGYINDSWNFEYQRKINLKSMLSVEYSKYKGIYIPPFGTWVGGPRIRARNINKINLTYCRITQVKEKLDFRYGAGINYRWGIENYTLSSPPYPDDLVEKYFAGGNRKDVGLSLRAGLDYNLTKRLSFFTHLDFIYTVFLEAKNYYDGVEIQEFFKSKYEITKFPSRYNLSLNFGIGYNF